VWGIARLLLLQVFPQPSIDKRNQLHTFLFLHNPPLGSWTATKTGCHMKSFSKIRSAVLLLCAFAASCGSDSTDPEPAPNDKENQIVIPEGTNLSPILSQDGESKTIRFTTKQPWQTYADDTRAASDWLHLSPTSGGAGAAEMTITAKPNETPNDRTGYVKIVSGNAQISFCITQKARLATDNTVHFPDANFKAYMVANFDLDEDGEISKDEALLITEISCTYSGIQSLEGIQYCTALTFLDCCLNQLTTLDVSKNTKLEWLDCHHNQLATLDVSKNTHLKELLCGYNPLEVLNLGNHDIISCDFSRSSLGSSTKLKVISTKLTHLDVCENKLQSLDVSECPALTKLDCIYNQLTTLNVSRNTLLEELNCDFNPLEVLNLGDFNSLSLYVNSTKFKVIGTKITNLKVSVTSNFQFLDVSECPALEFLDCGGNQLTTLDVSKNTKLEVLDCCNNQLTTLDVSKNTNLTQLHCEYNQLTSLDVSKNTKLERLDCRANQLTTLDVSKTNLGNSPYEDPLLCGEMPTLQTLYLKTGWKIPGVNTAWYSPTCVPEHTKILYKD